MKKFFTMVLCCVSTVQIKAMTTRNIRAPCGKNSIKDVKNTSTELNKCFSINDIYKQLNSKGRDRCFYSWIRNHNRKYCVCVFSHNLTLYICWLLEQKSMQFYFRCPNSFWCRAMVASSHLTQRGSSLRMLHQH